MKTFLQALLVVLLLSATPVLRAADSKLERPNILFILADDFGWRDLGCYGSTYYQTPNLDKLAARGMRFTQAYAANPLCSPTRSSILTGLWPARTGITMPACHLPQVILEKRLAPGNPRQRVLVAESLTRLKTDYVTLPKILRDAGYHTGHFGKWHLGAEPYSPLQQGYEIDWPHYSGPGPAGSYVAPWKFPPALGVVGKPGEHIEDTLSQHVADFIHQNKDHPFFATYWQFSVHAPYDAKDELVAKYRKLADPKNPQRNPVYAAMVESLDDGVGRVIAALEKDGLMDKTIIVFTSDNGGVSWGGVDSDTEGLHEEHKSARFQADMHWPPTSNLPLRNGKASLYEGGTREPCMILWPGVTRAGATNDTIIQSIDWMPTILDMVGVPLPAGAKPDGISIVPAIKGAALPRDAIFCHFPHDTPASGQHPGTYVRRGDWKLIRLFAGNPDGSDKLELYNLKDDLGERKNLAAEKPEIVRELNERITGFLKESEAVIPKLNPNYNPALAAQHAQPRLRGGASGPAPATQPAAFPWTQRQCVATVKDGVMTVTGQGATPFLGIGVGAKGPGEVLIRARSAVGGEGKVEWLPPAKSPGEPKSVPFQLAPGTAWQEVSVHLPDDATIGILRIYLPAQKQPVEVQSIELKTAAKPRRWDFK